MPELYEKELASPGLWAADGGPTLITPERIDRWEREFNQLRSEGFSFPTPYGHKLNAIPTADDPYALDECYAKWNAGYIEKLKKKRDGKLYMLATVPPGYRVDKSGNLINEITGTVIREVSPGFGDWTDGYGREHKDIIFHAALCTHPCQPGQAGFTPAGTSMMPAQTGQVRFLSTAGRVSGLTMLATPKGKPMADEPDADDKKKKKDKPPELDKPGGDAPTPEGLDAPGGDAGDEFPPIGDDGIAPLDAAPPADAEPPMPVEEPALAPDPAGLGAGGSVVTPEMATQFVQIMGQLGSPMLPGTNQTNILERLLILLHSAANQGASLLPGGNQQQPQPLDTSMDGATPDTNGMGGGIGGMAGGPTFMSTRTKKIVTLDPAGRALAEQAASKENGAVAAQWDRLAATPGVPATFKAICLREKAAASTYFMSLNPDTGKVLNERARQKLYFAKELLASTGTYKVLGLLSKGVAQATPAAKSPRPKPSTGPVNNDDLRAEIARQTGRKVEDIRIITGQPEA